MSAPQVRDEESARELWVSLCMAVQYATRNRSPLAAFMIARCRLPMAELDRDRPPWTWRGWALPYVIGGDPSGRWWWWLECIERRALPGPIPELWLADETPTPTPSWSACLREVGSRLGYHSAVERMVEWLAWSLHVDVLSGDREGQPPAGFDDALLEYLYRTFDFGEWLAVPRDYIGQAMCDAKGRGKDPAAFFPTPMGIVNMMTRMLAHDLIGDPRGVFQRVSDPCVGTGRFLLAASNFSVCLTGADIQRICVLATLVNGALYAPWLAFPFRVDHDAVERLAGGSLAQSEPQEPLQGAIGDPPLSAVAGSADLVVEPAAEPSVMLTDEKGQGLLWG